MVKTTGPSTGLSEDTCASILEAAPFLTALLQGPDHRIRYANSQFAELADNGPLQDRPLAEALPELRAGVRVLDRIRKAVQNGQFAGEVVRFHSPITRLNSEWRIEWLVQALSPNSEVEDGILLFAYRVSEAPSSELGFLDARDLKRMHEMANSLLVVSGMDGHYLRINPMFTQMLGWTPDELLAKPGILFVHPDDRARIRSDIERLVSGGTGGTTENRILHKDGSYRWISWALATMPHENAIYAVGQDITERKQAEEALRREAEANAFRVALADAIRPLEESSEIQHRAARMIGEHFRVSRVNFSIAPPGWDYAVVEEEYADGVPSAIGRHARRDYGADFAQDRSQAIVVEDMASDPRLGATDKSVYRNLRIGAMVAVRLFKRERIAAVLTVADTKRRTWSEGELALITEAGERVWAAIDRAETEAALRKSEEIHRLISRATNDVIWDWNPTTNTLEWNEALVSQLGYRSEDLPTREAWMERIHPDDRSRVVASFRRAVNGTRQTWISEYRFRKRNGRYATLLDRGHIARNAAGKAHRMIGSMLNVTERRRAEEALRQAHGKLLEEDRRKDEFLAMLAHELRNPLAAVQNAVQLLVMASADPRCHHYANIVERQTRTLSGLVDDLLDVSRVTRGLITLKREKVNLTTVAERALESVHPQLEEKNHQATITLPHKAVIVDGDSVRLEQILVNLLTNAAKYTDPGGKITLAVEIEDDSARVSVRDNGIGIAPDMRERIFTLFGQAARGLDRAQGGLGIGLTIVKNLVELHGGKVNVYSEGLGKGSEFTVTLPLVATEEVNETPPSYSKASPRRPQRILVVEDSPDIAETLALLLEDAGHQVVTASDGPTALDKASEFKPDLVLLDIGLPGMDGYRVARNLRQNPRTRGSRLAALTGYGQKSDRELTQEAGFNAHFVKPVDFEALKSFIDQPHE